MRTLALLAVLSGALAPFTAPVRAAETTSPGYVECLAEALQAKEARKLGADVSYSCYGDTARKWYDGLSGDRQVRDANGLFVARYYGDTGYCAHQIEDAAARPVSSYICEIVVPTAK